LMVIDFDFFLMGSNHGYFFFFFFFGPHLALNV
jgi:hypothetical protein